jgi:YVTN family beta-propeller protein
MNSMKFHYALAIGLLVLVASCKKEEEEQTATEVDYTHGIFISNEGSFNGNNASITYFDPALKQTNDVYKVANALGLGDVLQSFTIIGDRGYAIVNNSQKVEVVEMKTMKRIATITGVDYPRHLIDAGNGKAYLTNGSMAGEVKMIDLSTHTIVGSIPVGMGPEKMYKSGNKVFVCNSGGWSIDNTISVIDINTSSVVSTITVGDRPGDMALDNSGNLWALCTGETLYDENWAVVGNTAAMLYQIDPATNQVINSMEVGVLGDHPREFAMSADGTDLLLVNNGLQKMNMNTEAWTTLVSGSFNSVDVNAADGDIWCTGISNFVDPSVLYHYNSSGFLENQFTVGIGANGVDFN